MKLLISRCTLPFTSASLDEPGCASVMAVDGFALEVILLADFSFGDSVNSSLPMEPLLLRLRVLPKLSLDLVRGRPGDCCVAMLDTLLGGGEK